LPFFFFFFLRWGCETWWFSWVLCDCFIFLLNAGMRSWSVVLAVPLLLFRHTYRPFSFLKNLIAFFFPHSLGKKLQCPTARLSSSLRSRSVRVTPVRLFFFLEKVFFGLWIFMLIPNPPPFPSFLIVVRSTFRQDLRPGFGRHRRCLPCPGQVLQGCLRGNSFRHT